MFNCLFTRLLLSFLKKVLCSLSVPSLNSCMGLSSPTCKTLDLPWWNSWGCCQPIPLACEGLTEGWPSLPVYKRNDLTGLSLGEWAMSEACRFAGPTTFLKEKAVSFRDLARWRLGLCHFPLGSTVCWIALMFPLAHSAFAGQSTFWVVSESLLYHYCNLLNSKLIFSALLASYRINQ